MQQSRLRAQPALLSYIEESVLRSHGFAETTALYHPYTLEPFTVR